MDLQKYPPVRDYFSQLSPGVAFAAAHAPLPDDAEEYINRILLAATCAVESGLVHGYLRARDCSQKAHRGLSRICDAIRHLGTTIQIT